MIDFLIGLSISSLWIALAGLLVLFGLRLFAVLRAKLAFKRALFVLFMPCGVGYFRSFPAVDGLKRIYRIIVAVLFVFALLASFWVFYIHFA